MTDKPNCLRACLSLSTALMTIGALAAGPVPDYLEAALADRARPAEQVSRDVDRKPAGVLAFSGLQPGDRIADFMSGGAYYTRIFSRIVGERGRVYAFLPEEELKNCSPKEVAGTRAIEHDPGYANVQVLVSPVNAFHPPEPLDVVFTSLNFHDLFDAFMGPADVPRVARAMFDALKPGGALIVIDHAAQDGSGTRDTETLHRVDPAVIIREARKAGFTLEDKSDLLRNPADAHTLLVFDPAIRGHTDQVMLKFRKPGIQAQAR